MHIIFKTPNKFNMYFANGYFESVNKLSFANTFKNESNNYNLFVIPKNIRSINELMAHVDRLEYFITNNDEFIINILIKNELLELESSTPFSSDSLFQYENASSSR